MRKLWSQKLKYFLCYSNLTIEQKSEIASLIDSMENYWKDLPKRKWCSFKIFFYETLRKIRSKMKYIIVLFFVACGSVGVSQFDLENYFNRNLFLFESDCDYKLERNNDTIIVYRYGQYLETFDDIQIEQEIFNGEDSELIQLDYLRVFKTSSRFFLIGGTQHCFQDIEL